MNDMSNFKITMIETNRLNLRELDLEGKSYDFAIQVLKRDDLEIIYECCTSILTQFQRELYEKLLQEFPKELSIFLDPIIVSFALKDACDFSGVDYAWLDLDGEDEVGNSAWVSKEDQKKVIKNTFRFLEHHLEKYVIDAYDRRTREDLVSVWEAQVKLESCLICGSSSLERWLIVTNGHKLRCWSCSNRGHNVIVPCDTLESLNQAENEASK